MADHTELLGAPMVDVGPSIDAALDAWAQKVQPRVTKLVRKLSAPKEIVDDTQAWVKAKAPAARRSIHALQDNARDVAQSKSLGEATGKLRALQRRFQDQLTELARHLGRVLVCLYFLNLTWENVELYRYYREQYFSQPRAGATGPLGAPAYPWATVFLVAPAALACALGKRTRVAAGILTVDMLKEDTQMIYLGLKALIKDGMRPNELMVKKLSMFGCIALVFANAVRDPRGGSAMVGGVAGMLTDDTRPQLASRRKSALLLAGRLLMAALFVYVGSGQMARIRTRSQSWQHRVDPTDGHDNSWLILELVLSLPFAAGYKTRPVTLALAATLAAEALTCWRFWHYRADAARGAWALGKFIHSRSHFFTNLSVAGGLILLAGMGAGRYTVDHLVSKKRE